MDKKDILRDLFHIMYDWLKMITTDSDPHLGNDWSSDSNGPVSFYWYRYDVSSAMYPHIGASLYADDIVIWTKNKDNVNIVIHPVERSVFTGIYSVDVMLNTAAEFDEFSKEEMKDLYNRIIDFYKEKQHAVIHSEEELSDQKDTMEESKELPPFVKTRCIPGFDTDALKIGHPYRVTSERYGEQIMFLNKSSETLLHFFKLIVYDGEVQRREEYLVSIDNVVNDGYIIQEMN
jgi:hypothetical protein